MSVRALDEPQAVSVERPEGTSDFLLACDHASCYVPRALGDLGLTAAQRATHIAWDIGAAGVARALARALDATLVLQNYSRLVIDCNRPPGAPDLIPPRSGGIEIPGNQGLTAAARAARQREIYAPYHAALEAVLDARLAARRPTVFVTVHSFTPDYPGQVRPWHVGLLYHRDARLARPLLSGLRADPTLCVGDNEPYAMSDLTDYSLPRHGEARGIPHVGLEIRQDLLREAAGQQDWARRLATILPAALAALTPGG